MGIEDIVSPCIGVCAINDSNGFCQGCYRTVEEIREWWNISDQERDKVMGTLDQRLLDNTTF
ncbi:DUF1289 domain-containing protein [Candidatus Methylopumilus turicensis]|uniref:Fe-S protein n=1 Tax=Candidatus Methylopumilus turicensis TaxID=1581680 RepID=A0A0B7IZK6_9PROT|nr:DUF1289 domain-containing protein [Candidatus Methylopumilus turicensis]CEN56540.1 conserved protein of unknown function [Candidatus Methylopumilus turicensis]